MPPHIYVISLASAQDRRASMRKQLDPLGVPYTLVDAVHGKHTPNHPLFAHYNDKKRVWRRGAGSSLKPGQLGCFASHYLLWQQCVEQGLPIIVLEDDAILQPNFMAFYNHAEQFADHYGLVWLHPSTKQDQKTGLKLETIGPFNVRKFSKGFSQAAGYLLTPQAAQALLNYSQEWLYPVDNTMDRFFDHGVESIGLDPVCIKHDLEFESAINADHTESQRSTADRLRRELYSLKDNLARNWHNLRFTLKTKRRRPLY